MKKLIFKGICLVMAFTAGNVALQAQEQSKKEHEDFCLLNLAAQKKNTWSGGATNC